MKKNVTYLFGAGASAYSLPMVKYFSPRLDLFIKHIEHKRKLSFKRIEEFIPILKIILAESKLHTTIDTVAKKYFHSFDQNQDNLKHLKKVLTIFFFYEQITESLYDLKDSRFELLKNEYNYNQKEIDDFINNKKNKIDYRYDNFIASLLRNIENEFLFPDNVNILTWNYDCQFELAFQQFTNQKIYDLQKKLNIYPLLDSSIELDYWNNITKKQFKILHLNGQSHFYKEDSINNTKHYTSMFEMVPEFVNPLDEMTLTIHSSVENVLEIIDKNSITFSWERNSNNSIQHEDMSRIINAAKETVSNSKILVIVGYSFPFFNREIDKEIFLKASFDKIYIQDLNAKNIKELFINVFNSNIDSSDIIEYENVDQFLLPAELDADFPDSASYSFA